MRVTPEPQRVVTEGPSWGSIHAHKFLCEAVVLSDAAGQFNIGRHALCRVHAERLVHKPDTFNDHQRAAQQQSRGLIWDFCASLKAYRRKPSRRMCLGLRARFDRIFRRRTGFVALDRLLARLHANKAELLMVLERQRSRSTPTARRTTSAVTSRAGRSVPGHGVMLAVIAATPS